MKVKSQCTRDLVLSGELPFNVIFDQIVKVQTGCQSVSDPKVKEQLAGNCKISGQDGHWALTGRRCPIFCQISPSQSTNISLHSTVAASSIFKLKTTPIVSRHPFCFESFQVFPPRVQETSLPSLVFPFLQIDILLLLLLCWIWSALWHRRLLSLHWISWTRWQPPTQETTLPSLLPILSEGFSQDKMQQESKRRRGQKFQI